LRPEPFPLEVKIIALVDEDLYHTMYHQDPEIDELFKIRADFDQVLDRNEETIGGYCAFLNRVCRQKSLPPFHRTGAAAMVETGVERAGKQSKLSARLAEIADIAREAAYWGRQEGSPLVYRQHVEKAIAERRYRGNLLNEQLKEQIKEGSIHIETAGSIIGQVNGIALYDVGECLFANPCRITAQTSMGRAGVINIEREANLSGKFHDKGMLILCGYLRDRYAHDKPLNLSASICIEQFYADIEGDSASLAETCALLSSLGRIPVKQGIAVTGSISQKGEVQSVGCVSEKIEGFFEVCRMRGLNGQQGVIIPAGNVSDLMLPMEIVRAVEEGGFCIYQVHTVDNAMEILTGCESGQRHDNSVYPSGTIHRMVDDRLRELAEGLRDFCNGVTEEEERWEPD
jgi:predicted ATP-dependent protease